MPDHELQPGQFLSVRRTHETGRRAALQEISRSEPNLRNRIAEEIENGVVELAIEEPAWGQVRVANELKRKGLMISNAGVHCVERPTSRKQDSGSADFLGD